MIRNSLGPRHRRRDRRAGSVRLTGRISAGVTASGDQKPHVPNGFKLDMRHTFASDMGHASGITHGFSRAQIQSP